MHKHSEIRVINLHGKIVRGIRGGNAFPFSWSAVAVFADLGEGLGNFLHDADLVGGGVLRFAGVVHEIVQLVLPAFRAGLAFDEFPRPGLRGESIGLMSPCSTVSLRIGC
jgi:hypothetical protein